VGEYPLEGKNLEARAEMSEKEKKFKKNCFRLVTKKRGKELKQVVRLIWSAVEKCRDLAGSIA